MSFRMLRSFAYRKFRCLHSLLTISSPLNHITCILTAMTELVGQPSWFTIRFLVTLFDLWIRLARKPLNLHSTWSSQCISHTVASSSWFNASSTCKTNSTYFVLAGKTFSWLGISTNISVLTFQGTWANMAVGRGRFALILRSLSLRTI